MEKKGSVINPQKNYTLYMGLGLLIVAILVVSGILFVKQASQREYAFKEGFRMLEGISQKYNTSFHVEMLNGTLPNVDDIQPMLEDIKKFEQSLDKKSQKSDMKAFLLFLDVRKLMLTSEWYYLKGKEIGDVGLVTDKDGFSCGEAEHIINAAFYYNETFIYGLQAEDELDDLLYMMKDHAEVIDLVGINEKKTAFYKSDLKSIRHIPLSNLKSLDVYCGIKDIKHETTYTTPYRYVREILP